MDSLGIERASIIGHSMGGFIGASLAADFPEHVDRLMLVGVALPLNRRYLWQTLGPVRGLLDLSFDSFALLVAMPCEPVR
jgi:pimeloyl-ACP methyl ester carboxylesterase